MKKMIPPCDCWADRELPSVLHLRRYAPKTGENALGRLSPSGQQGQSGDEWRGVGGEARLEGKSPSVVPPRGTQTFSLRQPGRPTYLVPWLCAPTSRWVCPFGDFL